jgi:CheY-like chemotaxis protein
VLTALVVDDSAGARRRVATLLKLGGWQVHEAVGTEAALRRAQEIDVDLVVTDMVMRGGNGAALLHRLRNEGCRARSVVVAAELTDHVRALAAAAGALACLAKPVDPREFLDVMQIFRAGAARRVPAAPVQPAPVQPAPLRIAADRLDRMPETCGPDAERRALGRARLMELVALSVSARARMPELGQALPSA